MTVIGGPPVLRGGQYLFEVLLQGIEVERLELRRVVELLPHRVRGRLILVENLQV
jgi:hypothetical protein